MTRQETTAPSAVVIVMTSRLLANANTLDRCGRRIMTMVASRMKRRKAWVITWIALQRAPM
jgi:hypothetical protein